MNSLGDATPEDRYLDLLARCLTRELFLDEERRDLNLKQVLGTFKRRRYWHRIKSWRITQPNFVDPRVRAAGIDWPLTAETMVGRARLDNVRELVTHAVADRIPGDLVETGVWRGGTAIYLRALLAVLGDKGRHVWACDSYEGLPAPNAARYPADAGSDLHERAELAVAVEQVRRNFDRYGLLDDRVHFVQGWFRDTMPKLAEELRSVAVLRFDGDLYESAIDVLTNLEPLVSPGGFVIIDDYINLKACGQAVDDYRGANGITSPLHQVDWSAVWWRKPGV